MEVGRALSQTLEERQILANTLLQNRHYAAKHAVAHATSHPRVHNIQTTGEKAVPYNTAQPRAPSNVTMEDHPWGLSLE